MPRITMEEFNSCINSYDLVKLKSSREDMTWTNGQFREHRKWVNLVQALVNSQFLQQLNSKYVEYALRKSSDHKPMIIMSSPS